MKRKEKKQNGGGYIIYQSPKCFVTPHCLRDNVLDESFGADENETNQLEGYSNIISVGGWS